MRPDAFLADLQADLGGCHVEAAGADSYKDSEIRDFLDRAAVRSGRSTFRRVGAGKDGGAMLGPSNGWYCSVKPRDGGESVACDGDIQIDACAGTATATLGSTGPRREGASTCYRRP